MDRLGRLRTLSAIVEAGSLAGAAAKLRRSPAAVTRDLADLEAELGVRLVERTTRRCAPTPAGRRLSEDAARLWAHYEDAVAEAAGSASTPAGSLRLTAPLTFGRDHVAPLVRRFLTDYAAVSVELQLADRVVDLIDEELDLAVRIGEGGDVGLIGRTVGRVTRIVAASPAYLAAYGAPEVPEDLAGHQIVQHTSRRGATPWIFRSPQGARRSVELRGRFTTNQADCALAAARDGQGVVTALSYQVDADLRAGRLIRLLQAFEPEPLPVRLLWPESRRGWRRLRPLIDHLATGLSSLRVLRAGRLGDGQSQGGVRNGRLGRQA